MINLPTIDMTGTGQNINRLRKQAGLSVKDLQDIFGFATPQAIYKEMPPNNLRKPVAKFTDFIRFTLNKMRRLFSGSS